MKREITFCPAFHRVSDDPSKDYGVHGVEIHFTLSGPEGAIIFRLFTNWMLPETCAWWKERGIDARREPDREPQDAGVIFHSGKPMYEGHEPSEDACTYLGRPCYQDIGFTMAKEPRDILIREGDEGVWTWLERQYRERFCIAAVPA